MATGQCSARSGRSRPAVRAVCRALHWPPRALGRGIRRHTHAHGAGESGLGRLIELHAVNSAGDMLVTVALASTVFFSVPTGEARDRVALYLAVTLAPFVLLAPVIGPLLDRLPHGRRAAMASAMATRAVLALAMAAVVAGGGIELYPAALGVLVSSKAYNIVRSAVVPRLLPPRVSLVRANSRITLAGLLATGAAAPVGAGLHQLGPAGPLFGASAVFVAGMFLSLSLARRVDSAKGEAKALLSADERRAERRTGRRPSPLRPLFGPARRLARRLSRRPEHGLEQDPDQRPDQRPDRRPGLRTVGPAVLNALIANSALRVLSGLLLFFLAFMLREHPFPGWSPAVSLAVVGVAAGVGNACGTAIGAWLRDRGPEVIIVAVLAVEVAVLLLAVVFYGAVTVTAVAATAGVCQALGKLSLDALIQRDVPERVRTSAFARSETLVQMSWVVGGAIGIALPLLGSLGMAVAMALVLAGGVFAAPRLLAAARRGTPHPRVA